ncbi:hypothetical protein [Acinetobacter ursingii]|uniref:hypothetical protein n=2 Tax=Acinetobacter ursingii TaxID=108980 RepID=UPI00124DCB1D|nr:hypothetical protein [Acinetobacter ursingii]MCU4305931.1 hypothetical protein [Acinetobacter ursingii]MCU4371771.1 hypothetical protein [Acinetobacter ursingii]MCU4383077.1 hypothetical protein [Acinetobacter ursingii]MDG9992147.1 hypothetical protein [Acinetobacter ursingii]MDH0203842.1 hypothetical protein [Acinetobacter ursingii]
MFLLIVLGLVSVFAGRYVKNNFSVQNWSVNKRQAISILWFIVCTALFLAYSWLFISVQPEDIVVPDHLRENFLVNYFFKSIGSGLFMAFIFHSFMTFKINKA